MEQFRLEGVQREQEYKLALEQVKDQQIECETQAQQYEAQADDISKTLGQIKAGTNLCYIVGITIDTHSVPKAESSSLVDL